MKAIVNVVGRDRLGIIAEVSGVLYQKRVNILDLSQTIMEDYFTMVMLVDLGQMEGSFKSLKESLRACSEKIGMSIRIQEESIFKAMHQVNFGGETLD
ncbi:MAG: hypothetical protein AVO33_09380 [delta proteobacterium ML8_F1]|nr:MAG: hypothetical protein AVO33_09380 [delta proteobacterium ML8_F1]